MHDKYCKETVDYFHEYCEKDLRRLPKQFNLANIDLVRFGIDEEFLDTLGIVSRKEEMRNV